MKGDKCVAARPVFLSSWAIRCINSNIWRAVRSRSLARVWRRAGRGVDGPDGSTDCSPLVDGVGYTLTIGGCCTLESEGFIRWSWRFQGRLGGSPIVTRRPVKTGRVTRANE